MKASTLGAVLSTALIAACFVDRPSNGYECTTTADCADFDDNRQCSGGYCVVPNCPSDCTSCDEGARTCAIDCTSADDCGSVTCPGGWDCTINCVGDGACNNVTCTAGASCEITCTGSGACNNIDCDAACKCDLECAAGACDTPVCPSVGNGANRVYCTSDGTDGANCDSAHAAGCTKC